MKNLTKAIMATLAVAFLACSVFTDNAQAVPITGRVDFGGIVQTDSGDLGNAHAFTSFSGVTVSNLPPVTPTGSYLGTGGAAVTMNGFGFNPFVAPMPPAGRLWTFTALGQVYTFDLLGISSILQNATGLVVSGFGTAMISGGATMYDVTPGTFSISLQPNGGGSMFSFSATSTAPEGGSALALLGLGLVAVEALRRKLVTQ